MGLTNEVLGRIYEENKDKSVVKNIVFINVKCIKSLPKYSLSVGDELVVMIRPYFGKYGVMLDKKHGYEDTFDISYFELQEV